jgi:hypothetical protein
MSTELLKAIESINFDILEHDEDCKKGYYQYLLRFESNGCSDVVKFLGNIIHSSDDNDREWDEETHSYEPFQPYLLRKMSQEISKIKKIESLLLRPSENSLDKQD